jgi:hypothetical protein
VTDLFTFRDQIVTDLRPAVDPKIKIATHPGAITLAEVLAFSTEAPCLKVALLSGPEYAGTEPDLYVKVACYCITKNGKGVTYDKHMLLLASQVFGFVHATRIGGDDAERPQRLQFQNLYTRDLGGEGIGLGAVLWDQRVTLNVPAQGQLHKFLRLYQTLTFPDGQEIVTDQINIPQESI